MTKKLIWRLGKLPTVQELLDLINAKLITQDEAKEILFNESDIDERDKKSLEDEIKFLRQLVEKLSNNSSRIIENIRYIEKPYYSSPWWKYYDTWCGTLTVPNATITGGASSNTASSYNAGTNQVNCSFSNIKTF